MRDAVHPVAQAHGAAVVEVDVDAHPDLEAAYGERVPVLLLGAPADGVELCHYRFDRGARRERRSVEPSETVGIG